MDRNLDRIGVYQKNNFKTLLSKIDRALESRFKNDQTEIQKIRDEISINIFKILNRSGHKRYKRDTSALTAMYWSWVSKMLDNITWLKHQSIKYICSHEVFKSITWMQAGRWMISKEDFNKLIQLCTNKQWELDRELLKSVTSKQLGILETLSMLQSFVNHRSS